MTWNCAAGLAAKFQRVLALQPDILVLQECSRKDAEGVGAVFLGPADPRARKGVAVLALNPALELAAAEQRTPEYWWLLPVRVEGREPFNVLAVWAYGPRRQPSRLHLHQVVERWAPFIGSAPTIMLGDFNNSVVWDSLRQPHHRRAVDMLGELGLISAYHAFFDVAQGNEPDPTLFWTYNRDRPYHIDYIFIPAVWRDRLSAVDVGRAADWLDVSDHVPVVATLAPTRQPSTSVQGR